MTRRSDPFGEVEDLLEAVTGGIEPSGSPAVDVADTGEAFQAVLDLPGYEQDDIEVTLPDATTLQVVATRDEETIEEADRYVVRERRGQSVSRRIGLPEPVAESDTAATYENGVLTVTLPKRTRTGEGTNIPVE